MSSGPGVRSVTRSSALAVAKPCSDSTAARCTSLSVWCRSVVVVPSAWASSSLLGVRPSAVVRFCRVVSLARALVRTERVAQSSERSSSRMAPRIRVLAKRWNGMPRSGSQPRPAVTRACRPALVRSSRWMWFGMRVSMSRTR